MIKSIKWCNKNGADGESFPTNSFYIKRTILKGVCRDPAEHLLKCAAFDIACLAGELSCRQYGADGGTWTHMGKPIRSWTVRVCQFRHVRVASLLKEKPWWFFLNIITKTSIFQALSKLHRVRFASHAFSKIYLYGIAILYSIFRKNSRI